MKALRGCTDPDASPVRRPSSEANSDVDANRSTPFVSVVIPVFDDPDRLRTCLQALEHQTYPKPRYEVIVVDNGSARSVPPLVGQFGQARATYEMVPGANAARNRGISLARGEILAFTDADCVPARDWGSPSILVETVTVVGTIWSDAKHSYPRHKLASSRARPPASRRVDRTGPDRRHS